MRAIDFIKAARVPETLKPQEFGLWSIKRVEYDPILAHLVGFRTQTVLRRMTQATMHIGGAIVMEDSRIELARHLPIWLKASGRVLVTGLGLGCVVRGLLANRSVVHIDVVEIDKDIIRVVGPEFSWNQRVSIHHGDALTVELSGKWDFAWHDLWMDADEASDALQVAHGNLIKRFMPRAGLQGAWDFPRYLRKYAQKIGAPIL